MYCSKCGHNNTNDAAFCTECGSLLSSKNLIPVNVLRKENFIKEVTSKKLRIRISRAIGFLLMLIVLFIVISKSSNRIHFIKTETNVGLNTEVNTNKTIVEADNIYSNIDINNKDDAINLIKEDSLKQKDSCPSSIKDIENKIINEFDIVAVNLCEMNNNLANELYKTLSTIYNLFPSIKGNITNITIGNFDSRKYGVIGFYQPLFPFAQSKDYNHVYKMRIVLNARFFLNENLLSETIKQSSLSGYFPKNATITSSIAHEMGHYISFYAMRKNNKIDQSLIYKNDDSSYDILVDKYDSHEFSKQMLDEAYKLYLDDGNEKIDFDKWRNTISNYAIAKNESGKDLYDETIAEAFHDYYLNKDEAKLASKYIIKILTKYVEGV